MNILMSGVETESIGKYMRQQFEAQGHMVCGFGLAGSDIKVNICNELDGGTGEEFTERLYREAYEYFHGPVDVLINHAGMTEMEWTEDHGVDKFMQILQVNTVMSFCAIKGLLRQVKKECDEVRSLGFDPVNDSTMRQRKIINTSSIGTRLSLRTSTGYVASKCALDGLTRTVAKEVAGRYPVTVIGIAPGVIVGTTMTKMENAALMRTRGMTSEEAYAYSDRLGRKAEWHEVFAVYDYAVNKAPTYQNGAILDLPNGVGTV